MVKTLGKTVASMSGHKSRLCGLEYLIVFICFIYLHVVSLFGCSVLINELFLYRKIQIQHMLQIDEISILVDQ